jgi:hypothetical protein
MARVISLAEQVELNGLRGESALAKIAASNAPPMSPFLSGNALARFIAAEERRIFVTDRKIATLEQARELMLALPERHQSGNLPPNF